MSTRDIQAHVRELYGIDISADLVSAVTDSVIDEVTAWQSRPLETSYAIVFFDALRVKVRDEGLVKHLGTQVSGDRAELAAQLGGGHSILRVSRGGSQNHLYDRCDRESERLGAQGDSQ